MIGQASSIQAPLAGALNNESTPVQYTFNSRIMVAALVILFIVVFFVVSLHVYAKWFWRQPITFGDGRMAHSWRRRRMRQERDEAFVPADHIQDIHGGLDQSIRDTLPTFTYKPPAKDVPLECAVCLSEFEANEKGRLLPACKHSFHIDCIDMWFMSHSTCPLCRAAVAVIPTGKSTSMETSISGVNEIHGGHLEQGGAELHVPTEMAVQTAAEVCSSSRVVAPPPPPPFLWNQRHLSSQFSSPCLMGGHGSSSTRSLPSWSIEMAARRPESDAAHVARSISLSTPRFPSFSMPIVDDQGCSSSRPPISKSASVRNPIKWLLRKEMGKGKSRVFPASSRQGSVDLDHQNNSCPSSSSSTSLPV